MQNFIIFDFSTGSKLAQVQAEDADGAVAWFLSTRESYELDQPQSLVAISGQNAEIESADSSVLLSSLKVGEWPKAPPAAEHRIRKSTGRRRQSVLRWGMRSQ